MNDSEQLQLARGVQRHMESLRRSQRILIPCGCNRDDYILGWDILLPCIKNKHYPWIEIEGTVNVYGVKVRENFSLVLDPNSSHERKDGTIVAKFDVGIIPYKFNGNRTWDLIADNIISGTLFGSKPGEVNVGLWRALVGRTVCNDNLPVGNLCFTNTPVDTWQIECWRKECLETSQIVTKVMVTNNLERSTEIIIDFLKEHSVHEFPNPV